jgi:hypothetical protein
MEWVHCNVQQGMVVRELHYMIGTPIVYLLALYFLVIFFAFAAVSISARAVAVPSTFEDTDSKESESIVLGNHVNQYFR